MNNSLEVVSNDKTGLLTKKQNTNGNKRLLISALFVCLLAIIGLAFLNMYQAGWFDKNDESNNGQSNTLNSCINGEYYVDRNQPSCECYSCYTGMLN